MLPLKKQRQATEATHSLPLKKVYINVMQMQSHLFKQWANKDY